MPHLQRTWSHRGLIATWIVLIVTTISASSSLAQEVEANGDPRRPSLLIEGVEVDPDVPTLHDVLGYDFGQRLTDHAGMVRYLDALARAKPQRTRLSTYGISYEGRTLHYLVISSEENMRRLDLIQGLNLRAAKDVDDQSEPPENLPAILWLAYSVHGDETSSTDAALITAYHALADLREESRSLFDDLILIIDPLQNPDGRDRFIRSFREASGAFPDPEPLAAEHTQMWARGRLNHYLFDMNRDWFMQTQQETRAKVRAYLAWQPHIYVDAHEMGANSTFYFDPPTDPVNPLITDRQKAWFERLGTRQAEAFDQNGFAYTTRELFDAFFPGYGSTWPLLHGGVGILWEQAGVRGLTIRRDDELILQYRDAVAHHYVSGLAYLTLASEQADRLVGDFLANRREAYELAQQGPISDYLLLPSNQPSYAAALAQRLIDNGLIVERVTRRSQMSLFDPEGNESELEIPEGAYRVSVAQPDGLMARALLDEQVDMPEDFLERQRERIALRKSDEIYDVTSWSLPKLFNVPVMTLGSEVEVTLPTEPITNAEVVGSMIGETPARVGYLIAPNSFNLPTALAEMLRLGVRVRVLDESTTLNGTTLDRGSLLVRTSENPDSIHDLIADLTDKYGLNVFATETGYADQGAGLGGPNVRWVKPPKILMLVDGSTSTSVGATWYLFDQVVGYPTTRVKMGLFPAVDLNDYNVLIMPDGSYLGSRGLEQSMVSQIQAWVEEGGTLITLSGATRWACDESVGLLQTRILDRDDLGWQERADDEEDSLLGRDDEESAGSEPLPAVPGAILAAQVDQDHWLTLGLPDRLELLVNGNGLLKPLAIRDGRNLIRFVENEPVVSGFCWEETASAIAGTPYLVTQAHGAGHVVGFMTNPNFRAWSPVANRLVTNAAFFGPGH